MIPYTARFLPVNERRASGHYDMSAPYGMTHPLAVPASRGRRSDAAVAFFFILSFAIAGGVWS